MFIIYYNWSCLLLLLLLLLLLVLFSLNLENFNKIKMGKHVWFGSKTTAYFYWKADEKKIVCFTQTFRQWKLTAFKTLKFHFKMDLIPRSLWWVSTAKWPICVSEQNIHTEQSQLMLAQPKMVPKRWPNWNSTFNQKMSVAFWALIRLKTSTHTLTYLQTYAQTHTHTYYRWDQLFTGVVEWRKRIFRFNASCESFCLLLNELIELSEYAESSGTSIHQIKVKLTNICCNIFFPFRFL